LQQSIHAPFEFIFIRVCVLLEQVSFGGGGGDELNWLKAL